MRRIQFLVEMPATHLCLNGQALEGVGVEPDRRVEHPLTGSLVRDPQMDAAIGAMADLLRKQ